jgi:hypothetical protein
LLGPQYTYVMPKDASVPITIRHIAEYLLFSKPIHTIVSFGDIDFRHFSSKSGLFRLFCKIAHAEISALFFYRQFCLKYYCYCYCHYSLSFYIINLYFCCCCCCCYCYYYYYYYYYCCFFFFLYGKSAIIRIELCSYTFARTLFCEPVQSLLLRP